MLTLSVHTGPARQLPIVEAARRLPREPLESGILAELRVVLWRARPAIREDG